MVVFLLTAGHGTRLRPLTNFLAKPTLPFLGAPIAIHALNPLRSLDVTEIVFNTHHLPDTVRNCITNESLRRAFKGCSLERSKIHLSSEYDQILGGGAIKKAESLLSAHENFWLVNGDVVYLPNPQTLGRAWQEHCRSGAMATLIVLKDERVGKQFGGVWCKGKGVMKFSKKSVPGTDGYHFTGFMILSREVLAHIPPEKEINLLYDTLQKQIDTATTSKGPFPVRAFVDDGYWFETGNWPDYLASQSRVISLLEGGPTNPHLKDLKELLTNWHRPYGYQLKAGPEGTLFSNAAASSASAAKTKFSGCSVLNFRPELELPKKMRDCMVDSLDWLHDNEVRARIPDVIEMAPGQTPIGATSSNHHLKTRELAGLKEITDAFVFVESAD